MWSLPYEPHPDYARFKSIVYAAIDPRMQRFFPPGVASRIRLDEIDWGGVTVNGIPPLYYPKTLSAADARYLRDGHVVFGVVVNGAARAYPKRILAWHEMAVDGLAGSGLQLTSHPAVTTTWGEWKAQHPGTTVLSLDTGHKRDYGEGAAYRDYFSHDRLYFQVSRADRRLKNKAEVLVMRVRPASGAAAQPVAIAADFLKRTPVFHVDVAGRRLVVVTSRQGANRVYALNAHQVVFPAAPAVADRLLDTSGRAWTVSEAALTSADGSISLPRYTAHRAFWFGWFAQYPDTLLIGAD